MKKTYTTTLPDQVGAFRTASALVAGLGLNITRVSYNKAVDVHTLFLEVEGTAAQLACATERLAASGYLPREREESRVLLLEFRLRDVPGSVLPVLRLIERFHFNISYISSQQTGEPCQHFRMGLLIENSADLSRFMREASRLCQVRAIDYDQTEKVLDNTVFYVAFANRIAETCGLTDDQKADLIVNANLIMELLDRRNCPPYKTFDYIGRFAEQLAAHRGTAFLPRVTFPRVEGVAVTLIEPPCGSNLCVLELGDRLLFVDSGFACYRAETLALLHRLFPDIDRRRRDVVITHADVDHCGLLDWFDHIYLSRKCYDNFARERAGRDNFREKNPLHAPYVRISKILSDYAPPPLSKLRVIGGSSAPLTAPLESIGEWRYGPLCFQLYEGQGGHVAGEIVLLEPSRHLAFTGDILVNLRGFTAEQAAFNRLAPYLMTSVDSNPTQARAERAALNALLAQERWQVLGGHGGAFAAGGKEGAGK